MAYNYIKKPKVKKAYTSLKYSSEDIAREKRREKRAKELGMKLYLLDDTESSVQLVEFENYILETFIDKDIDVPDNIKEEYKKLKNKNKKNIILN